MRHLSLFLSLPLLSGCVGYVLQAGYHEAELLGSRRPIERILTEGRASAGQEQRLRLIPSLKAYGKKQGLSSTENYETVAWNWEKSIYNVSACDPVSFTPRTWTFPIVGKVPYLGFFTEADASRWQGRLTEEGLDVWVRTAGAFSTLGWFRDPVLPNMLLWDEADLAETVFHELAHATLWVPGSVDFNESFASFVGEEMAEQYLTDTYGPESESLREARTLNQDYRGWQVLLHALFQDLDSVYRDPSLSRDQRLARKAELFAALPSRVLASDLVMKERWAAASGRGVWNNARLYQYRTYNTSRDRFLALLQRNHGDILAFIHNIQSITKGRKDPFVALSEATRSGDVQSP